MIRLLYCLFIILLILSTAQAYTAERACWLDKTEPQLKSSVPSAAWQSVSTVVSCYKNATASIDKKPFEISYILVMMQHQSFQANCFSLLNEVMKREKELERGHSMLEKEKNLPQDHSVRNEELRDYRFMKCRLRVMAALAKAGVAGRMAESGGLAYSSQAMESAIDTIKEAASYTDRSSVRSKCLGNQNPSSDRIMLLRSRLLSVWDECQKKADVKPLVKMNLQALTEELVSVEKKK